MTAPDEDELVDLSRFVTVSVTSGEGSVLTRHGFLENWLRMGPGPRSRDELLAFFCLGGHGFAANRRARRAGILEEARLVAERVGHGEAEEPMTIAPDQVLVPLECADEVRRIFGGE